MVYKEIEYTSRGYSNMFSLCGQGHDKQLVICYQQFTSFITYYNLNLGHWMFYLNININYALLSGTIFYFILNKP